jgi:hypothetical protein
MLKHNNYSDVNGVLFLNLTEFLEEINLGKPLFYTLINSSLAKITKLTIDDFESNALFEVMTTAPGTVKKGNELNFLYKKIINLQELQQFFLENFSKD